MKLRATFGAQNISVSFRRDRLNASTGFPVVKEYVDADPYEGSYVVIPEVSAQVLPTLNKRMTDDLTVTGIPYYEVSNTSGITVYIAENLND